MCHQEGHRENVYRVWRKSFDACQRRSSRCGEETTCAVAALLAELRQHTDEDSLVASYWEPGDWPGELLLRHLPAHPGSDGLLELEEAAFWLRYQELACHARPIAAQS